MAEKPPNLEHYKLKPGTRTAPSQAVQEPGNRYKYRWCQGHTITRIQPKAENSNPQNQQGKEGKSYKFPKEKCRINWGLRTQGSRNCNGMKSGDSTHTRNTIQDSQQGDNHAKRQQRKTNAKRVKNKKWESNTCKNTYIYTEQIYIHINMYYPSKTQQEPGGTVGEAWKTPIRSSCRETTSSKANVVGK